MKRATVIANRLGMIVFSSPTQHSRYKSLTSQAKFLSREIYFLQRYRLVGE